VLAVPDPVAVPDPDVLVPLPLDIPELAESALCRQPVTVTC
jgi:hypothetical protein